MRATLPPGAAGRRLVLAERADAGWRATLDGRRLAPGVHAGWAQAFELPAWGGELVVEHRAPGAGGIGAAQVLVLVLALLLGVPLPRRRLRLRAAFRARDGPGRTVDVAALEAEGPVTWPVPVIPPQRGPVETGPEDRHDRHDDGHDDWHDDRHDDSDAAGPDERQDERDERLDEPQHEREGT